MTRIVLVGMMGSGKSTIGRHLSEQTGWPLYDNDALLAEVTGTTARDLLATRGERALRAVEEQALVQGLAKPGPCIVDAAAGIIESARARGLLLKELVIWLRAEPETLYRRSKDAAHRPWLDRGEKWFHETAARRAPLFESVADFVLDTDEASPRDAAMVILESLLAGRR